MRGIHPQVLTDRGLDAALSALAARSTVPVTIDVDLAERPPASIEACAYFVVAESLANLSKHSGATKASVRVEQFGPSLLIDVRDDGRGGAVEHPGGGLSGLRDRVAAVEGTFRLSSPQGRSDRGPRRAAVADVTTMRVVIAEDSVLLREGITRLLAEHDAEVVAALGDASRLLATVRETEPDLVIVDVRMPPTFTDEGLRAAVELRSVLPGTPVLVLSQYVEERFATELLGGSTVGVGYLLKERVADVSDFVSACRRVAIGGTALDPDVVAQLLVRSRRREPLASLTPREREVLGLMAEGLSNAGIAQRLGVGDGAVEKHITSIMSKLELSTSETDHRRVLAVLTYLGSG